MLVPSCGRSIGSTSSIGEVDRRGGGGGVFERDGGGAYRGFANVNTRENGAHGVVSPWHAHFSFSCFFRFPVNFLSRETEAIERNRRRS